MKLNTKKIRISHWVNMSASVYKYKQNLTLAKYLMKVYAKEIPISLCIQ